MSEVTDRVEARFDQAVKYIEKNRGWRPQPRTVAWLTGMLVVLVASAIIVPRVLPGKIADGSALLGRGQGISIVPLGAGAAEYLIEKPVSGGRYSCWAINETREEVAVGWYDEKDGKVDRIAVKVKSAYSGRTQTEWAPELSGEDPRIAQAGYVPQHNLIWFLADGRLSVIDIKSAEILPFPFKSTGGRDEVEAPEFATYVAFSPGGRLAYAQGGSLTVVKGLATSRLKEPLSSGVVFGIDANGMVLESAIESFTWLDDDRLAVVMKAGTSTPVYLVSTRKGVSPKLLVPAPASGSFSSITLAPDSSQFALVYTEGETLSIRRFEVSGRMVTTSRLPKGDWYGPLSW